MEGFLFLIIVVAIEGAIFAVYAKIKENKRIRASRSDLVECRNCLVLLAKMTPLRHSAAFLPSVTSLNPYQQWLSMVIHPDCPRQF